MNKPGHATAPTRATRAMLRDSPWPRSARSFPAPVARVPGSELVSSFVPHRSFRSLAVAALGLSVPLSLFGLILVIAGCALPRIGPLSSGWLADYDTAEQRIRESGEQLLIFYADTRPGADRSMERALKSDRVKPIIADTVRCMLVKSYEPDRRYVAQYGVDRAPALVLVHADGTYHAQAGSMSVEKIAEFLAAARPPGAKPILNPFIPRQPKYNWLRSIDVAEEAAERTSQPMLIVFHRRLSHDWRRLEKLLSRHEVYMRLADMVHCRIGMFPFLGKTPDTPFGAMRLPALVIVRGDGTYDVLELPTSCEAVVRFADTALRTERPAQSDSASAAAAGLAAVGPAFQSVE